ncbi:hypothetical protein D3C85_1575070 [compost metagenome]
MNSNRPKTRESCLFWQYLLRDDHRQIRRHRQPFGMPNIRCAITGDALSDLTILDLSPQRLDHTDSAVA